MSSFSDFPQFYFMLAYTAAIFADFFKVSMCQLNRN